MKWHKSSHFCSKQFLEKVEFLEQKMQLMQSPCPTLYLLETFLSTVCLKAKCLLQCIQWLATLLECLHPISIIHQKWDIYCIFLFCCSYHFVSWLTHSFSSTNQEVQKEEKVGRNESLSPLMSWHCPLFCCWLAVGCFFIIAIYSLLLSICNNNLLNQVRKNNNQSALYIFRRGQYHWVR